MDLHSDFGSRQVLRPWQPCVLIFSKLDYRPGIVRWQCTQVFCWFDQALETVDANNVIEPQKLMLAKKKKNSQQNSGDKHLWRGHQKLRAALP